MFEKIKLWLANAGFTSVVYGILFIINIFIGKRLLNSIGFEFLHPFLTGAFFGIFLYVNWNVIGKIWKDELKPRFKDKVEDVVENIKK